MAITLDGTSGITTPGVVGNLSVSGNTTVGGTLVNTGLITASAGVAIGGVGAANTLDDYEEGTYTVTMTHASGSSTLNSSQNLLGYVKVGNLVTISGQIQIQSSNGTGQMHLTLPFAANTTSGESSYFGTGIVRLYGYTFPSGAAYFVCHVDSANLMTVRGVQDSGATVELPGQSSGYIMFGMSYRAA